MKCYEDSSANLESMGYGLREMKKSRLVNKRPANNLMGCRYQHASHPKHASVNCVRPVGIDSTSAEDISPSCSLTQTDYEEIQQTFDKKHNLMEMLGEIWGDFKSEVDLSNIKDDLLSFSDLSMITDHPEDKTDLESWKHRTDQYGTHGDVVLQDVLLGLSDRDLSLVSCSGITRTSEQVSSLLSNEEPDRWQLDNRFRSRYCTENMNSNMSRELSTHQIAKFNIPVLQRVKWKCRSAPDLRECEEREEPIRTLSQYDLPLFPTLDKDGRKPLFIDSDKDKDALPSLLWGQEAYRHYKLLTMIETKERLQMIQSAKAAIIKKYIWKQKVLQNIVNVAKAYYRKPCDENREKWKQLRKEIKQNSNHSLTDIRHRLAQIPRYAPYFTLFLMMAHIVSLSVMCIVGKLGPVGMLSEKQMGREIQTFLGAETLHRYITPNPWIGPPARILLVSGASFGLCMRRDRSVEEQGMLRRFRKLDDMFFGCCEMRGPLNAAGTTTQDECSNYTNDAGVWRRPHCGRRPPGQNSVAHVIRPCCVDHRGTCQMVSLQHCNFLGGTFHVDREHCVEVLCVRDVCRIGLNMSLIKPNPDKPWLAEDMAIWQWWRLLLALFYTFGIMHCLPLLLLEWLLMRPMEGSAGWFTVAFIYVVCGVAGQIVSCTAQPYIPHVGSTSGVAGMIGEAAVELSQAWTYLESPGIEVVKLTFFFVVLVVMGFLPYVSLLGTLTGCVCGAICALIFMPYLTFNVRGQRCKRMLMTAGVLLLLVFFSVNFYTFDKLQPHPCQSCRRLDCLSFADDVCNQWDLLG